MSNNLVVLFNERSILSLVAIFLIVAFTWRWDRKWEEENARTGEGKIDCDEPSEKPDRGYEAMEGATKGIEDDTPKTHTDKRKLSSFKHPQSITMAFVGWVLLAFSNLLPRKSWIRFHPSELQIISSIILLCLGVIQSIRIPTAIVSHKFCQKESLWNGLMIVGMLVEGIMMYFTDRYAPFFAVPLGGTHPIFRLRN